LYIVGTGGDAAGSCTFDVDLNGKK